jgi:hypothetical protein
MDTAARLAARSHLATGAVRVAVVDTGLGVSHEFPIQCTAELADAADRLATADRLGARPGVGTTTAGVAAVGRRNNATPGGGARPSGDAGSGDGASTTGAAGL